MHRMRPQPMPRRGRGLNCNGDGPSRAGAGPGNAAASRRGLCRPVAPSLPPSHISHSEATATPTHGGGRRGHPTVPTATSIANPCDTASFLAGVGTAGGIADLLLGSQPVPAFVSGVALPPSASADAKDHAGLYTRCIAWPPTRRRVPQHPWHGCRQTRVWRWSPNQGRAADQSTKPCGWQEGKAAGSTPDKTGGKAGVGSRCEFALDPCSDGFGLTWSLSDSLSHERHPPPRPPSSARRCRQPSPAVSHAGGVPAEAPPPRPQPPDVGAQSLSLPYLSHSVPFKGVASAEMDPTPGGIQPASSFSSLGVPQIGESYSF